MHIFLSYPKSGRTWVRFMIDSYLCRMHRLNVDHVFEAEKHPDQPCRVEWTHLTAAMVMQRPYWQMGPWQVAEAARLPWMLLIRNFYATMASAYFQARDRIGVFQGSPGEFLRSSRYGIIKLATFYNLWDELKPQLAQPHVFCYEALIAEPRRVFEQILTALDLSIVPDLIDRVVAEATSENMRRLSVTPQYAGTVLAPTDPTNPATFKVRRGRGPGYKQLFSQEDLAYLDQVVDAVLTRADCPEYRACRGAPPSRTQEGRSAAA